MLRQYTLVKRENRTVGEPPVVRSRGTKGTAQKRKSVPPPIPPLGTADAGGEVSAEKSDETVPVVRIRTYEERYNVNTTADSENKPDNTAIEEKVESVERIAKSEAAEKAANDAESSKGNSGHKKAMVAKRGAEGPTQTRGKQFLARLCVPSRTKWSRNIRVHAGRLARPPVEAFAVQQGPFRWTTEAPFWSLRLGGSSQY